MWRALAILMLVPVACSAFTGFGAGFSSGGAETSPEMVLPDTTFIAVGSEFNAWYSAIGNQIHGYDSYVYSVACDSGGVYPRSFRWNPDGEASATATFTARGMNGASLGVGSMVLTSIADDAGYGTHNVMLIGDSLIQGTATIADSLRGRFTDGGGADIDLIGTQGSGDNEHEAYTGKGFSYFVGSESPFWDTSVIDVQGYIADNLFADPDYFVIALGVNDAFGAGASVLSTSTVMANATALVDSLLSPNSGYPDAKVLIVLQPVSAIDLSAFGDDYNTNLNVTTDQWIYYQQNMARLHAALIAEFDGGSRANVDVCAARLWVDRKYGYASTTAAVSSYDSTEEAVWTNYVHPDVDGKTQMAVAIYSHLRHFIDSASPCENYLANSYDFATPTGWSDISANSWFTITGSQPDVWGGSNATLFAGGASATNGVYSSSTPQVAAPDDLIVASIIIERGTGVDDGDRSVVRIMDASDSAYAQGAISWAATPVFLSDGTLYTDGGIDDLGGGVYRLWVHADLGGTGRSGNNVYVRVGPLAVGVQTGEEVTVHGVQLEFGVSSPCGDYVETP